jgi:hypothetical protein
MTTRSVTLAALLAALGRPSWWVLSLAGFLIRGGIALFVVAIVSLPSPLALSNVLRPIVTSLYFGNVEPATVVLLGGAVVGLLVWLIGGGWIAAAADVALIRDAQAAAAEDHLPTRPAIPAASLVITRATTARFLALLPLVVVAVVGSIRIVDVIYAELTNPSSGSPIVLRVLAGASGSIAVIVAVWILGEIIGGLAVRRIVLGNEALGAAVVRSAFDLIRHPGGSLLAPLVALTVLALDLAAVLVMVAFVWSDVRERLTDPSLDLGGTVLGLVTFGAAWSLALLVTGLIAAWRSAAMTFETERAAAASGGPALGMSSFETTS